MEGLTCINQPVHFKFPKRSFGKKNPELRSFNPSWFKSYPWLHYDEVTISHIALTIINFSYNNLVINIFLEILHNIFYLQNR